MTEGLHQTQKQHSAARWIKHGDKGGGSHLATSTTPHLDGLRHFDNMGLLTSQIQREEVVDKEGGITPSV